MVLILSSLYFISLLYIFLFSLGQLHLTWVYGKREKSSSSPDQNFLPRVTVQLPVYNEQYVVERLLDSIAALDYPREKLEIQVLDDSTDETTEMLIKKIEALRPLQLDIQLIHRENRNGFKAGALDVGGRVAKGEFIAIFDADFLPSSDFLKKTIPHFSDPQVGVVQTRWGHLNENYSVLTQLQAFGLNAHFTVEQTGRQLSSSFINFNGTGGVWRKRTIEDAGGWSADTLTEDLDLSYRAQLKGWKFQYLEDVVVAGELPVLMSAIKSQQYRWNKGAAETARKHIRTILRTSLPNKNKLHALFHLFNSSVFVCLMLAAMASVPMLYVRQSNPIVQNIFSLGLIFIGGFFSITIFYWVASKRLHPERSWKYFLSLYPKFLIVFMGLSLHNSLAVIEGWMGRKTPFIRTPKFNIINTMDSWRKNIYVKPSVSILTVLEGLLCLYFCFGLAAGWMLKDMTLLLFHTMLALGFGSVFIFSVKPFFHGR